MTSRRFLSLAQQHWYVVVLGLLVALGAVLATTPERVYWTSEALTVVQPQTTTADTSLEDTPPTAVPAATVLMRLVNDGKVSPRSNSADATLYGEGARRAVSAKIRDVGGQWATAIPNPIIDVQVVEASPAAVRTRLDAETAKLREAVSALQRRLHVQPSQQLIIESPQFAAPVVEVSGSKIRAVGSGIVIVLLATAGLIFWLDRAATGLPPLTVRPPRARPRHAA